MGGEPDLGNPRVYSGTLAFQDTVVQRPELGQRVPLFPGRNKHNPAADGPRVAS
jgi:hypothetical protein